MGNLPVRIGAVRQIQTHEEFESALQTMESMQARSMTYQGYARQLQHIETLKQYEVEVAKISRVCQAVETQSYHRHLSRVRECEAEERKAEIEARRDIQLASIEAHKEIEVTTQQTMGAVMMTAMQHGLIQGQFSEVQYKESEYNFLGFLKGKKRTLRMR